MTEAQKLAHLECFEVNYRYERRLKRKGWFDRGLLHVVRIGDLFHIMYKDWSICAWSSGDSDRARAAISTAVSLLEGLRRDGTM